MHTAIEEQDRTRDIAEDKAVRWEALRSLVNTIGARDALAVALTKVTDECPVIGGAA